MKKFLTYLSGAYLIILGLAWMGFMIYAIMYSREPLEHSKFVACIVFAVLQIVPIAMGVGLILRKEWARLSTLVSSSLFLVLGLGTLIVAFVTKNQQGMNDRQMMLVGAETVLFIVIPILLLFLFNDSDVKGFFAATKSESKKGTDRPFGVTLFAIYQLFNGGMGIAALFRAQHHLMIVGPWVLEGVFFKIYAVIMPVLVILIGVGLFKLNKNAWKGILVIQVIWLAILILNIFTASDATIELIRNSIHNPNVPEITILKYRVSIAIDIVINSLLIAYLITRKKFFLKKAI